MRRRYVWRDSDLPDHDLILELSGMLTGLHCHVRHYVHEGSHVVIAGQLSGEGVSPIANAVSVAQEVADVVVPPGQELAMVAYTPQSPLSGEPHFHEVTFEVDGRVKWASAAVFGGPKRAIACFRTLDLAAVEADRTRA